MLCETPVLQIPEFNKEFILVTDVSELVVSADLHHRVNGDLAPMSYYSRLLTLAGSNYSIYEKECLSLSLVAKSAAHI